MSTALSGKHIAILFADGVEQVELVRPLEALKDAGADVTLLSTSTDDVQAMNGDIEPADTFTPDQAVGEADAESFDALVLPGGTVNPDKLRIAPDALAFVKALASSGKPIAAICHGPWTLVETGLVRGKTLTSWPSLKTDIENAGGTRVDEEVVTCPEQGFTLVTSRNPDDLDAFCKTIVDVFAG